MRAPFEEPPAVSWPHVPQTRLYEHAFSYIVRANMRNYVNPCLLEHRCILMLPACPDVLHLRQLLREHRAPPVGCVECVLQLRLLGEHLRLALMERGKLCLGRPRGEGEHGGKQ